MQRSGFESGEGFAYLCARDGEKAVGGCVYAIEGDTVVIRFVEGGDGGILDGLARTALAIAANASCLYFEIAPQADVETAGLLKAMGYKNGRVSIGAFFLKGCKEG